MAEMLDLAGGGHRFSARWIFRGLSFQTRPGELLQITGPNGAGKTTLLRILATLLSPTEGVLLCGPRRLEGDHLKRFRRSVGVHLTRPPLYPDLTVEENLDFFDSLLGRARAWRTRTDLLEPLGLLDVMRERVRLLSDGFRARAALARLFLAEPEYLFLDEPFSHLDRHATRVMVDLLASLARSGKVVVLAGPQVAEGFMCETESLHLALEPAELPEGAPV